MIDHRLEQQSKQFTTQLEERISRVDQRFDQLVNQFQALEKCISTSHNVVLISKNELIAHFEAKLEHIYFDHAEWRKGERQQCERLWVSELCQKHSNDGAIAELDNAAQIWLANTWHAQVSDKHITMADISNIYWYLQMSLRRRLVRNSICAVVEKAFHNMPDKKLHDFQQNLEESMPLLYTISY